MKNLLMILAIIGIVFWVAVIGWDKHDRGECEYWVSISSSPYFLPTKPMVEQCNHYGINIKWFINSDQKGSIK